MILEGKIFPYKKTIKKLYQKAAEILKEDFSAVCISVNFVSGEEIESLNKKFRNIDKKTDVLSFPNLNKKPEQTLDSFAHEKIEETLFLGDIVICKQVAFDQAKEYGHSKKREICFLALHGLLHLMGYDHIDKDDEKLMNATAELILNSFGVTR